jgi:hypothetical protein
MSVKGRFSSVGLVSWLILTFGQVAWPQSTVYFDRNAFISAAQGVPGIQQSISFEELPSDFVGPVLTISDVTFTGRDLFRNTASIPGVAVLYNLDSGFPMGIQFANGARVFGADFSSLLSPLFSSFTATISLDTGEVLTFTAPTNPNSAFFGFVSPIPIKNLTYSDGGLFHPEPSVSLHEELIGNIYMVSEIPEPHTFGTLVLGAAVFGWRWRRIRKP